MNIFDVQVVNYSNEAVAFSHSETAILQVIKIWLHRPDHTKASKFYVIDTGKVGIIRGLERDKQLVWEIDQAVSATCNSVLSVGLKPGATPIMRLCLTNRSNRAN